MQSIYFSIFNCIISVNTESSVLFSILEKIYGAMAIAEVDRQPDLEYSVYENKPALNQMSITRSGMHDLVTSDIGEFIFFFEKDMTIELQKIRSDLLFIHSAALDYKGKGILLVAPSGTGKSTTTWAMVNSGFKYLSDELAPIDLNLMLIEPYPHAINLKAIPPVFDLPSTSLYTSQTIHVPCKEYTNNVSENNVELKAIFFLEFGPDIIGPEISIMSKAAASASLYANSLNILAHNNQDEGLQVAIKLASQVKAFKLVSNQLDKTCNEIKVLLKSI